MIVTTRLYNSAIACEGLAFIGDPHIDSRRPGRRTDDGYAATILRKVEFCVEECNRRRLFPIILGDLYNTPIIVDESIKTRLVRILKECWAVPIQVLGNHETVNERISDADSIATLATSDIIDLVVQSTPVCEFIVSGVRFGMGATPYVDRIPRDISGSFPGASSTLWLTHHDIAFDETYPNAVPPFEIKGCDVVVNGHVHATKAPVQAGSTIWFNPGNINRQSIDLVDHVPKLWTMDSSGQFTFVEIPHAKDVFDLTGKLVRSASGKQIVKAAENSRFVELLARETTLDLDKSDDGSLLREEIDAMFELEQTSRPERALILSLLGEAVERRSASS